VLTGRFPPEVVIKSLSDQQLVEQAKCGNRDALAEIYARHKDGVYNYCLRFIKDKDSAKDAVHETFLRMYSGLEGIRNGMVLRVWLLSIARNFALNSLRKNRVTDPLEDEPVSEDDSPFEAVLQKEQSQTVKSLIDSLQPSLREVIVLREYEELSYREIAMVTGLSEENVKVRIYRARKAIAAGMKERM
jgi:RNA polymerase sigma-70 factor (ECF subfamily)